MAKDGREVYAVIARLDRGRLAVAPDAQEVSAGSVQREGVTTCYPVIEEVSAEFTWQQLSQSSTSFQ